MQRRIVKISKIHKYHTLTNIAKIKFSLYIKNKERRERQLYLLLAVRPPQDPHFCLSASLIAIKSRRLAGGGVEDFAEMIDIRKAEHTADLRDRQLFTRQQLLCPFNLQCGYIFLGRFPKLFPEQLAEKLRVQPGNFRKLCHPEALLGVMLMKIFHCRMNFPVVLRMDDC